METTLAPPLAFADEISDDDSWSVWARNNAGLFLLLFLELVLVLGLYLYHRHWMKSQRTLARKSDVEKQSESYAHSIVRHFLPSIKVEKYRFRGLRRKSATVSIAFEDLGLQLKSGAQVLDGVNGEFKAGRMCAIMGPSGAGKTTFMNVLCGKASYGDMTGHVFINGEEGDISHVRSEMGFVPQNDVVHENLTVAEQLAFSAQLRGAPGLSARRSQMITEDVLSVMQIDHIRNSLVGGVESRGISGGQRKRVNIGLELAADPTILFLDEPTSGLDSTSSLTIVHSLKKLTELGMTAIMVIHQPRYSLFTLFDDVLLLGKGGRTVYLGPSTGAKPYFEGLGFQMPDDENPSDWFMDVISGEIPNQRVPKFQPSMLFDMWEQRGSLPVGSRNQARRWTKKDDRAVLDRHLTDQWSRIDVDGSGVMDEEELHQLLTVCQGNEPDDEVVAELFQQMAKRDEDVVTKQEFLDFLLGLREVVAPDASASEASPSDDDSESAGEVTLLDGSPSEASLKGGSVRRGTTGFGKQLLILLHMRLIQWWRSNTQRAIYLAVIVVAAMVLAIMDKHICPEPLWSPGPYLNLHTTQALLTSVFCLGVFSQDRPMFWRERASGLNVTAFFASRLMVNFVDLLLQSYSFSAVYYLIRNPNIHFGLFYLPFLLVTFAASGIGYCISAFLPPAHGPFVAALVSFVSCGLLGHPDRVHQMTDGGVLEVGMDFLSLTRWSVGMSFVKNLDEAPPRSAALSQRAMGEIRALDATYRTNPIWQKDLGYWGTGAVFLLGMGLVMRVFALLGLRFMNRDKQV